MMNIFTKSYTVRNYYRNISKQNVSIISVAIMSETVAYTNASTNKSNLIKTTCCFQMNEYRTHYKSYYLFTDINECESRPCQHEGSCYNTIGSFSCHCTRRYSGRLCELGMIILIERIPV